MKHTLRVTGLDKKQHAGLMELSRDLGIECSGGGIPVHCEKGGKGIKVQYGGSAGMIRYEQDHQLFRALSLFAEGLRSGADFHVQEEPVYDTLGFMVDCSRNAVLHDAGYQRLIRHLALMGYSQVQLYMEDTFELQDYPYFGHMRGRYSGEALSRMDAYAGLFGIEVVPCIQTLAHLEQPLRWPAFSHLLDCNDILLVDEEETYHFIDAMFKTLSGHLTSRQINIGMDEAHMLGLGKHLDKHGYQDRMEIMLRHFDRVMQIARKYGYKPMMWSDMFFRLANGGEYYDLSCELREDVIRMIPNDVKLVYWDYYSEDPAIYDGMMAKHKQLCDHVVFAGGAWKWMGFSPNNHFSKHVGEIAHESCRKNHVRNVLLTGWGDNGAECSVYAILPALQLWAELCYRNHSEHEHLAKRFETCTQGRYDDFMQLDLPMLVPDNPAPGGCSVNPPKYILYQDILCGLFDKHVSPGPYAEHYRHSASVFRQAAERNPGWRGLFDTQASLCDVLEIKSRIGIDLREAYQMNDLKALKHYAEEILPELIGKTKRFMQHYTHQWHEENKIFGLDVFDLRMGGLLQRMHTAKQRIEDYLAGDVSRLDELEQDMLYYNVPKLEDESKAISMNIWNRIASASVLAGML
ncbi:family 20 glycosylhydrolase [Paenibacillus dokdonensis]|uniref:family 20 glycosylhydrolase n=1 Tax=Paenibacillus dokdonensis TaxID=2567944 RepID=UPI0010A8CC69|nr:family 20 glycosylhydrolase [Paenibacillus dokdonensis]